MTENRTYFGPDDPPEEQLRPAVPPQAVLVLVGIFVVIPILVLVLLLSSGSGRKPGKKPVNASKVDVTKKVEAKEE
jgi:hypothetical protein